MKEVKNRRNDAIEIVSHIVYLYTNKVNGKSYVGITCNEENRKKQHQNVGYIFHKALKKYGIGDFDYKVLKHCQSRSEAYKYEKEYICELDTMVPNGYNITPGGTGTGNGEKSSRAILNEEQVKDIIADSRNGVEVAMDFGVSSYTIGDIRRGKTWKHLDRSKAPNYDNPYRKKLDKSEVQKIIKDTRTAREVAKEYQITVSSVRDIRKNKYHKDIERNSVINYRKETRKITPEQAEAIVLDDRSHAVVARQYGISSTQVSDIRKGKSHKDINRLLVLYKDGRRGF